MTINGKTLTNTDKIGSLTIGQAQLLYRLMNCPSRAGFASDNSEAGPVGVLHKLELVRKFGRFGNRQKWQASEAAFKEARHFLGEIVQAGGDL